MRFFVLLLLVSISAFAGERPNIIFVLADDLGYSELGCYGNDFHETPHLDQLAKDGLRFTQAYAAAPVCSPYRAALLTGQHPARLGILDYLRPNSANGLSTDLKTLPQALGENGYATGMVGKWHLTGYKHHEAEIELRPTDHGFGWNVGSEVKGVGNGANTWPYVFREQPIRWLDIAENRLGDDEYLTDRLNLEAVDFVEKSAKSGEPFFLYLSHYAPHTILNGRPDLVKKYIAKHPPGKSGRENCYICEDAGHGKGDPGHHWAIDHNPHLAAMLESIDDGIGKIAAKLEELGIADNTILIFTSDNGGETNVTSNALLRGGKSQLYEGGIRVPLIVRWPSEIKAGAVCEAATVNTDFYPTLLEAADIEVDADHKTDGISTLATWKNPDAKQKRDFIAWHYPLDKPHFLGGVSSGAIRSGDWKLIENFHSGKDELFSLANDVSESKNLAAEKPEVVSDLKKELANWREEVGARIPSPPLLTETRQLSFGEHFTPGRISEQLWYGNDWIAEDGILKRVKNGSENTRIFWREAQFQDSVIRFDFRMGESNDLRLVTGSGGHYNTVIHVRPDHFFIQTAKDNKARFFSYRHGECAFDFEPDHWYSMTVEFLGNECIAHLDTDHVARAVHPIIDQERKYLALQVDEHAADFDNLQIFKAVAKKGDALAAGRKTIESADGKFPVKKSIEEHYQIQKTNAHEWFYQRDPKYKALVDRVDKLDALNKKNFPAVNQSHKDYKKKIADKRKHLHKNDPVYKETLFATHRANRAIDTFLIEQKPEIDELASHRKKAEINRLRSKYEDDERYQKLVGAADAAQKKLEADHPELFVSDEEINAMKKSESEKAKDDPEYQKAKKERADAYRAAQDYLFEADEKLAELDKLIKAAK